jgi:thiamine biosynthesis lipoprotein
LRKSATDLGSNRSRPRLVARGNGWLGTFTAMASTCEVHLAPRTERHAGEIVDLVADEAWRIEAKFSRYRADSAVSAINAGAGSPVSVDEETARLIDYADQLFTLSGGKFDITSGALRRVWSFDGSDRVPRAEDVTGVLRHIGWSRARWQRPVLTLEAGMELDFGGIGKEYAVDRAAGLVAQKTQCCLINFGGDLRALGPDPSGRPWRVGIEAVDRPDAADRLVELTRGALATSGDTRRYLLKDGRRYGHILDPTTGWPIRGAPRSVTVVADTCTQAGMLATLAMLQGSDAERFLAAQGVRHWCVR